MIKFNWGSGIALAYGIFALSMIGAVLAARRHPPGLVQKNYYDLDLNYQEHLEKKQHAAALTEKPQVIFTRTDKNIEVRLPEGMYANSGTVKLYRPATTRDDFSVPLEKTNALSIPAGKLASGRWNIELDWETAGKKYFWETALFVQL
jgi:nitrogen fixation protein FixH